MRDGLEQFVADRVAQGVVHLLEPSRAVQIDQQKSGLGADRGRLYERLVAAFG